MSLFNKKRAVITIIVLLIAAIVLSVWFVLLPAIRPVVIKSKNYGFTSDMISYMIGEELDDYVKQYENNSGQNYLDAISLSPEKNLKKQDSPYGGSWFDYFYDIAVEKAKNIIFACEAANAENISLSAEEKSSIDSTADSTAKKSGIKKDNLKKLLRYRAISEKYKDSLFSKYTDSDYKEYYNHNKIKYDCIDYKCITVRAEVERALENKNIDELNLQAENRANQLLNDIRLYGFDQPVQSYLQEIGSSDTLEKLTFTSQKYIEDAPFFEWAFSSERKPGDAVIFPGKYSFSIYYLESIPYPYDYTIINGVIAANDYRENSSDYLTNLRSKLARMGDGKKNFDKFVSQNSFSVLEEGLIFKDSPLPEPVLKWMYSENRKPDDVELCIYGKKVFAMRYVGSNDSYFNYILENDYRMSVYDSFIKDAEKSTKIKINNKFKFLILR